MSQSDRAFLDVENSVTGQKWVERANPVQLRQAELIVEQLQVGELAARIIASRGVTAEEAELYLNPTIRELMPDPLKLTSMDKAVERLADAVEKKQKVAIFGDYDVDGATSSALMQRFLTHFGLETEIYIPDRIFEGYGPNGPAISELIDRGAELLVTVDCGSTSDEALALAREQGVDALVLDHHQVNDTLPDAAAIVNPNRQDDMSGLGYLCAAGVVFVTLVGLNRELRDRGCYFDSINPPNLMEWLDIVALGTICDVVPLTGLNRAFVKRGIEVIHRQKTPGLVALARSARQDGPAAPWHLGFVLGPRINAGGRIGDAALGARLLTTNDPIVAQEIAEKLEMLNGERQAMEKVMLEQAINEAEAEIGLGEGPSVLVTESEHWHAGVVGLLASRLKDRFRRPAFAITFDHRGIGTGSGRSIAGVDIGSAVRSAVEQGVLEKGGGHAMAAGITIKRENLSEFRSYMEQCLSENVGEQRQQRQLKVDGALSARGATTGLIDELEKAGPFGAGNSQPVFVFPHHTIRFADVVGANHVRFTLASPDGAEIRGIAFKIADEPLGKAILNSRGKAMHFAGTVSSDFFRGTRRVQMRLLDAAEISSRI